MSVIYTLFLKIAGAILDKWLLLLEVRKNARLERDREAREKMEEEERQAQEAAENAEKIPLDKIKEEDDSWRRD